MAAKWELGKIHECINCTDDERFRYTRLAEKWESMYRLNYWKADEVAQAEDEKRRLVTASWPRTTAQLAMRLIEDKPQITVPSRTDGDDLNAKARQRFLEHAWDRQRLIQRIPPVMALKYTGVVLGRMCLQVVWRGMGKRFPILIRPLRPEAVGVEWGPDGPMWAYHTYCEKAVSLSARYPKAKLDEYDPQEDVTVTDFWYVCQGGRNDGMVYNAVLVGNSEKGSFLKAPEAKKDYPFIPILCAYNDPEFAEDPAEQGGSILKCMGEDWGNMNLAQSFLMTGMEQNFWPKQFIESEHQLTDDFEMNEGPGETTVLPPGASYREITSAPNVQLLSSMIGTLDQQIQNGTFSNVLYGNNQGVQAGYALANLANSARTRVHPLLNQLQSLMQDANSLILAMAENFGASSGIELWGYDDELAAVVSSSLEPRQIGGFYENHVQLGTNVVGDELQKATVGLQQVQGGIISKRTYREDWMPGTARCDEEEQIIGERAMEDPDVFRAMAQRELLEQDIVLPPNEPDGIDTLAQDMAQQQQMQAQQQVIPQAPLPPEMNGQLVPESLGLARQGDPALFQQLIGQQLTPEMLAAIQQGTFNQ